MQIQGLKYCSGYNKLLFCTEYIPCSDWTCYRNLGNNSFHKNENSHLLHPINKPFRQLNIVVKISDGQYDYDITWQLKIIENKIGDLVIEAPRDGIVIANREGINVLIDNEDWFYKIEIWEK